MKNHNKVAELPFLEPKDTKQLRPINAATLKKLEDPDEPLKDVINKMKTCGSPPQKFQGLKTSIRLYIDVYSRN